MNLVQKEIIIKIELHPVERAVVHLRAAVDVDTNTTKPMIGIDIVHSNLVDVEVGIPLRRPMLGQLRLKRPVDTASRRVGTTARVEAAVVQDTTVSKVVLLTIINNSSGEVSMTTLLGEERPEQAVVDMVINSNTTAVNNLHKVVEVVGEGVRIRHNSSTTHAGSTIHKEEVRSAHVSQCIKNPFNAEKIVLL